MTIVSFANGLKGPNTHNFSPLILSQDIDRKSERVRGPAHGPQKGECDTTGNDCRQLGVLDWEITRAPARAVRG